MTPARPNRADDEGPPPAPWDPDRAAARRPGLIVVEDPVAGLLGGGFLVRRGDRHAIVLDPGLHPWQRRAALAHELVHAERGIVDLVDAPPAWAHEVASEERRVRDEVADRLVPAHLLAALVEACRRAGDPVTAEVVAVELEVPVEVADLALRRLGPRAPGRWAAHRAAGRVPL